MNVPKVRWGILGTGKIAQDFTTALQYVSEAEIVAVGSRNLQSAEDFGNRFNIKKRHPSYEDLAKDPQVEVIYVSTIHPLHYENTLLCLNHGKNVLCEKPLTVNSHQSEETIKLAREKNLFYMEGMWTRFFPSVMKVRELIANGTLGNIKLVIADFGFKNPGIPRLVQPELGGGALLDVGVYPISIASMIFGPGKPSKITSSGFLGPTKVDDQGCVTLTYKEDQQASLIFTLMAETPKECIIIGDKGRVKIHAPFWCSTSISISLNGQEDKREEFPLPEVAKGHTFNFSNSVGMSFEASHVNKMLKEGKKESNIISLDESLTIMRTMDEVRRQLGVRYSNE